MGARDDGDEPAIVRVLMPLAVGALAGGALGSGGDGTGVVLTIVGASSLLAYGVSADGRRNRTTAIVLALATAASAVVAVLRAGPLPLDHVARHADAMRTARRAGPSGPAAVDGLVRRTRARNGGVVLTVRTESVQSAAGRHPVTGLLAVTIAHPTRAWPVGTRVRVVGRLRQPRNFGNPGGYDMERALVRQGIFVTMFLWDDTAVTLLEAPAPGLEASIAAMRERIALRVAAVTSDPVRGFLIAVLSGSDGAVTDDTRDLLARTGLAHTISVSGFHVAVVAGAAVLLARAAFRRFEIVLLVADAWKLAALTGLVPVIAYSAIAGGSVPALRSVLMYGAVIAAVLLGRPTDGLRALAGAALVLALAVPDIAGDISFQLSFASVAALVLTAARLRAAPATNGERPSAFRRAGHAVIVLPLQVSIAAAAATTPLTAWHFQHVSLIAPLANLLTLPFLGPATLLPGLAALPLLDVAPVVADALLAVAGQATGIGFALARACARIPYAAIRTPMPSAFEVLLLYAWIALFACLSRRSRPSSSPADARPSMRAPGLCAAVLVLGVLSAGDVAYWIWERTANPRLRITFLSVGQGDAAVVELPRGGVIVIDGGGLPGGFDTGDRLIAPFLRARKVMRLEALVLSHPQLDHYGGLAALAEQFAPREFWSNGATSAADGFGRLDRALGVAGTRRRTLARDGAAFTVSSVGVDVWHPGAYRDVDPNNGSLVLRLTHGRVSVVFTGDIEAPAEAELVAARRVIASTVLKVAHHGSATSSTASFLAAIAPGAAIISAGADNRFGFPAPAVLTRLRDAGTSVWRTDLDGAVRMTSDGERLTITTARAERRLNLKSPHAFGTRERS